MNKKHFLPSFLASLRNSQITFKENPKALSTQEKIYCFYAIQNKPIAALSEDEISLLFDLLIQHIFKRLMEPGVISISIGKDFGRFQKRILPYHENFNPITGKLQIRNPLYVLKFLPSETLKAAFKACPIENTATKKKK